jgi:hypothetical protein
MYYSLSPFLYPPPNTTRSNPASLFFSSSPSVYQKSHPHRASLSKSRLYAPSLSIPKAEQKRKDSKKRKS